MTTFRIWGFTHISTLTNETTLTRSPKLFSQRLQVLNEGLESVLSKKTSNRVQKINLKLSSATTSNDHFSDLGFHTNFNSYKRNYIDMQSQTFCTDTSSAKWGIKVGFIEKTSKRIQTVNLKLSSVTRFNVTFHNYGFTHISTLTNETTLTRSPKPFAQTLQVLNEGLESVSLTKTSKRIQNINLKLSSVTRFNVTFHNYGFTHISTLTNETTLKHSPMESRSDCIRRSLRINFQQAG